ncbi:16S rRNA pseudouridine(516) synthase [Thalassomonas sp. RHCl1]|uniref:16S rRNA pseudouridine(516) synthase n=1 Tax=Thalassomonas sp. RHCl1 TaxID=2995320 RepID=UPI00248AC2DA|nr:16S rRNA pseudouridine(516) synthase [Thalassomonas sp. RHCl1]
MTLSTSRLDRFISKQCQVSRRDVRLMLAQKRIMVDGAIANNIDQIIDKFSHISLDNKVLQANEASYVMLHKPVGVVSATKDEQHKTVLDIVNLPESVDKASLHLVGRLDLNTSGLVLLTNDSRWSERLTSPEKKVEKLYRVTLQNKLNEDYIEAFNQGMYFGYEKITTKPAKLEIISDHVAMVSLVEGRYHQIKRMFGRFRNPVVALHRVAIGSLILTEQLKVGESRLLTAQEVAGI